MHSRRILPALITITFALSASAADAMRKLDFLTGDWKGEASISMEPGGKTQAVQTERVRTKAGGQVLLIEGLGREKLAEGGAGKVVHDALAVISWDEATKKYQMQTWTERGGVQAWLEAADKKVVWGFDTPQGAKIRYTIWLDEQGQWVETGEYSADGKSYVLFFDMKLAKVE